MSRLQSVLFGLLAAYAASLTLFVATRSAEARVYRRAFSLLYQGKHGRPPTYPNLIAITADFGLFLSPWEASSLLLADFQRAILPGVVLLFLAVGVGAGLWTSRRSPSTH